MVIAVVAGLLVTGRAPVAGAAPPGYPLLGLDVSEHQGVVNWAPVVANGATFAYVRSSHSGIYTDTHFSANYRGAKAAGLFVGAYHFARPDASSGAAQADFFINQSQYVHDGKTLPPMLDIEWPPSNWQGINACYNLSPAQMVGWIRDFVNRVAARTGQLTMIYTNPNWWNPCTGNNTSFGNFPLFNSGYLSSPPAPPAGWATWTMWQYAAAGTFPGDQDVLNGDYATLQRLAGGLAVPLSLRADVNGRFVTADNFGHAPLVANRAAAGRWERFYLVDAGGGDVALRSNVNGRFVTAESAGNAPLVANRGVVGAWERFKIVDNGDGSVSLKANVNGMYVTAESAGTSPLIANRSAIGSWEKFTQMGPVVTLHAAVNNRYVAAENGGELPLIANRTAVGAWEQFDAVDAGGGFTALRSRANGLYVTAENSGNAPLIANRSAVGAWERFLIIANPGGSYSLRANVNGRFVTAENFGNDPLIANRTSVGLWEQFHIDVGG